MNTETRIAELERLVLELQTKNVVQPAFDNSPMLVDEIVLPSHKESSETIPIFLLSLFGYTFTGTTFTVLAGEIHLGTSIVAVSQTDVTIAADNTYVAVRMTWTGPVADIVSSTTKQVTDETYFYKWLYKVGFASGVITGVTTYGHTGGAIVLTSAFAQ